MQQIREGAFVAPDSPKKKPPMRRSRYSFGDERSLAEALNPHDKAMIYGNMALEYDVILQVWGGVLFCSVLALFCVVLWYGVVFLILL